MQQSSCGYYLLLRGREEAVQYSNYVVSGTAAEIRDGLDGTQSRSLLTWEDSLMAGG